MRINSEKIVTLPQILHIMADLFAFTYEEKKRMAAQTAEILEEEIGLKGEAIEAVYLIPEIEAGHTTIEAVEADHGLESYPATLPEESCDRE